jgi:predicted metal-dependent hydrolase
MEKEITLEDQRVAYTLKKNVRSKRLRLAIYCDGTFVVTAPPYLSFSRIEEFILQKAFWILEKLSLAKKREGNIMLGRQNKAEYRKLKKQALALAVRRIEEFNQFYGYEYNNISIRNQKTRWGSCSQKGNLNFNYKIALLPEKFADYIIVHELCHLQEFNHSKNFWELVGRTIPDYRSIRREIRKM